MSIALIRELWSYHHWANRRLFDTSSALGADIQTRDLGTQWSAPTLTGMFVHLYGADRFWLQRWKGATEPAGGPTYGLEFASLGELRTPWDDLVSEQREFLDRLADSDLARMFKSKAPDGTMVPRPFGMMLLHVPNHATHHRSEIATMLTMVSGSPPETGINTYYWEKVKAGGARP